MARGEDSTGDDESLDEEFPRGDGTAQTEADVICPYCFETVTIGLDPGSGAQQTYDEDCQVCCRPWTVRVEYGADGDAEVSLEAASEDDDA